MISTEKSKKIIHTRENDDLTTEEANELLKDSNFAKQLLKENNTSNISLELKARPRLLNN